jgi:steroid 5-alpha reductase family enzyme
MAVGGILALKALGYLVFRGANSQKDLFRREPSHPRVASLRTMPTERGTRLIISGWWGIARHINYTGDWLMG